MENEKQVREPNPQLQKAALILLAEYLPWLFTLVYFFNSLYSEVSYLDGFVFGFPLICTTFHTLAFVLVSVFGGPQAKKLTKANFVLNLVVSVVVYALLFVCLASQPYK